ncbi:hypothetical protein C4J81_08270 [Deltaproteobacteria bacterium Smac51]|nr:hypothetical protein C4J81_08270 [Deltaproteobacteria bacterium Smac51]
MKIRPVWAGCFCGDEFFQAALAAVEYVRLAVCFSQVGTMVRGSIRLYKNSYYGPEKILGAALLISLGLHILVPWIFVFAIPAYETEKQVKTGNIIILHILDTPFSFEPASGAQSWSESYEDARGGMRLEPEMVRYYTDIRDKISRNWRAPASAPPSGLSVTYQLTIEPDGTVSTSHIRQSSGNIEYDKTVEIAIEQSSPFPPLPAVFGGKADHPALRFRSGDMLQGD